MTFMLQKINNHINTFEKCDLVSKRWDLLSQSNNLYQAMYRKFPLNEKYFFELNPSFAYEYKSLEVMLGFPFVMLRNGFYGLYYFFLKNIKPPKNCTTTFLIPHKFKYLIPESWKDHVLVYSFNYTSKKSEKEEKLVVYGIVGRENFINDKIKDFFNKKIPEAKEVIFLSPLREQGYLHTQTETELYFEFQKAMFEHAGFGVKQFNNFRSDHLSFVNNEYDFINIDQDNFLIYDDYLSHFFATKGAYNMNPIDTQSDVKLVKEINLSPYHSIKMSKPNSFSDYILRQKAEVKLNSINVNLYSEAFFEHAIDCLRSQK